MRLALKIINLCTLACILVFIPLGLRQYLGMKSRSGFSKEEILNLSTVTEEKSPHRDYSFILRKNIFGLKAQQNETIKEVREGKDRTDVLKGYKLLGTISDGRGRGYAVVEDPSGEQQLYKVGQGLKEGGTLKGVWSDHIIVGPSNEKLTLVDISEIQTPPSTRHVAIRKPERGGFSDIDRFIQKRGTNEYVVDRQKVEEALENPEQLMTDARLKPVFRNGKQYGFVLLNLRPNGIYSKLGLRNGDVLMKINEFDITDPETALRAFNELRGADEIVLHIKRGGREQTLRYIIE